MKLSLDRAAKIVKTGLVDGGAVGAAEALSQAETQAIRRNVKTYQDIKNKAVSHVGAAFRSCTYLSNAYACFGEIECNFEGPAHQNIR